MDAYATTTRAGRSRQPSVLISFIEIADELRKDLARVSVNAKNAHCEAEALLHLAFKWRGRTSEILASVLREPASIEALAKTSYRHAAGFHKIILVQNSDQLYRASLHIWNPRDLRAGDSRLAQEVMHDHNMPFAAAILAGAYSQRYGMLADTGMMHTAFHFGRLEYEPRGQSCCNLRIGEVCTEKAGSCYTMTPDQLHQLVALDLISAVTVSLFLQGKFHKDIVTLYVPGRASTFPIVPRVTYDMNQMQQLLQLAQDAVS